MSKYTTRSHKSKKSQYFDSLCVSAKLFFLPKERTLNIRVKSFGDARRGGRVLWGRSERGSSPLGTLGEGGRVLWGRSEKGVASFGDARRRGSRPLGTFGEGVASFGDARRGGRVLWGRSERGSRPLCHFSVFDEALPG